MRRLIPLALAAVLSGCGSGAGTAPPPPLTADHATDLAKRWLAGQSSGTTVAVVSLAPGATPTETLAKLTISGFHPRGGGFAAGYAGEAEARFSWYRNSTWSMNRFTAAPGDPAAKTWDGLMITDTYVALEPVQRASASSIESNEDSAIANVRKLLAAELTYSSRNQNSCGSMKELSSAGLVDERFFAQAVDGYRISVNIDNNGCAVLAIPQSYGMSGKRSFFSTPADGVIHYTEDQRIPNRNSPVIQ